MNDSASTSELIDRLVKQSGIRKKLAAELLHAIPEIIEDGLKRDGEVRVKGLGTFRMKWTQARPGRNPKTGESVEIPPRYRLVFLPEQSLKEFINRDFRLLSYKVISDQDLSAVGSQQSAVVSRQSSVASQQSALMPEREPMLPVPSSDEVQEEIENDFGSVTPVRKRRIHWIIPAAISVIIVLSLVFYFRNFYPVGGQRSAVGSRQSAVGSRQSADTVQSSKFKVQSSETTEQSDLQTDTLVKILPETNPAKLITQNSNSKLKTPDSKLKTQNSKLTTISQGQHLFKLAREVYGNPFLWVLIYKANQDLILDPDQAISGKEIKIPVLEGTPDKLSRNDSLEVSEGYRLVYEFYKAKGDSRAEDFFKGVDKFNPNH